MLGLKLCHYCPDVTHLIKKQTPLISFSAFKMGFLEGHTGDLDLDRVPFLSLLFLRCSSRPAKGVQHGFSSCLTYSPASSTGCLPWPQALCYRLSKSVKPVTFQTHPSQTLPSVEAPTKASAQNDLCPTGTNSWLCFLQNSLGSHSAREHAREHA